MGAESSVVTSDQEVPRTRADSRPSALLYSARIISNLVFFALLGLGIGSMYAALALGLVVVHRGTGFVNFALGGPMGLAPP